MQVIEKYFKDLSPLQTEQLGKLGALYADWNEKINVISRKDIDNLYVHHVLHSLALVKANDGGFAAGTRILDIGTGGGFPGIPLAIMYPEVEFELVDSVRKKITVVNAVAEALGLKNVKGTWSRAEELKSKYDFIVTRAVAPLAEVYSWCADKISSKHENSQPNGIWAWKGDSVVKDERRDLPRGNYIEVYKMSDYFGDSEAEFFATKVLVYVQPPT
jgi:16S rRNA (guanine527-N7)-methyltransferase